MGVFDNKNNMWFWLLVLSAYILGVGNIMKMPPAVFGGGLGALLVYLVSTALMAIVAAVALATTRARRYDIMHYFYTEFKKPALGLIFLVFPLLVLRHCATRTSWLLMNMFYAGDIVKNWQLTAIGFTIVFIALVIATISGRKSLFKGLAYGITASLGLFIIGTLGLIALAAQHGVLGDAMSQFGQVFVWKGMTLQMFDGMVRQAACGFLIGMGFYFIVGAVLPRKVEPLKLTGILAVISVSFTFLGVLIAATLLAFNSNIPINEAYLFTAGLKSVTIEQIGTPLAKAVFYLLSLGAVLASFTTILALIEPPIRVVEEITRKRRKVIAPLVLAPSYALGLAVIYTAYGTGDLWLMKTVDLLPSYYLVIGAMFETIAIWTRKSYIEGNLKLLGQIAVGLIGFAGIFFIYNLATSWVPALVLLVTIPAVLYAFNTALLKVFSGESEEEA